MALRLSWSHWALRMASLAGLIFAFLLPSTVALRLSAQDLPTAPQNSWSQAALP